MAELHPTSPFFTVGGTLPPQAAYVVRPTDEQLFHATLSGEYCNVLTPRQTGKSSLMVRTVARLRQEGIRTVVIDLTDIGAELDADEWYLGLVTRLTQQLHLEVDERAWWDARAHQGVVQRFSDFMRDVVLAEVDEPVVVFVDEIDSTLSLPFTDDFFAAIRAAYNARASDPAYKRLTFVLLGVARPADLIKNRSRTPYNIGLAIDLRDFTLEEAQTLLPGLEATSAGQSEAILQRVLHWTGGHPYLTQKVCAEVVAGGDDQWPDERIDELTRRLFLSDLARKESNLQYARDRILEHRDRARLLHTYRQVLSGQSVPDEERDPVKSQLKLAGLIRATPQGTLVVRNHIYEQVFDAQWVEVMLPRSIARWITIASIIITLLALAMVASLLYRQQNETQIRVQTYTEGFLNAQSAAVRMSNLAGLFRLGDDESAASARDLFFGLDDVQQLAIFTDLTAPEQMGEDLQTVVVGLYTHLEDDDQHTALLQAMVKDLKQIETAFPDSRILCVEIEAWIEGKTYFQGGDYEDAVDSYTQAIGYNGKNPATYLDRALAYTHLDQYDKALVDLSHVIELDPGRRSQVANIIRSHSPLHDYLTTHRQDFPTLAPLFESTWLPWDGSSPLSSRTLPQQTVGCVV